MAKSRGEIMVTAALSCIWLSRRKRNLWRKAGRLKETSSLGRENEKAWHSKKKAAMWL
jgi:hypothetical protein